MATHVSTVEARGGSRTVITRNILLVSLVLIVDLLIIAVSTGYLKTSDSGADEVNGGNAGAVSG